MSAALVGDPHPFLPMSLDELAAVTCPLQCLLEPVHKVIDVSGAETVIC